MFRDFRYHQNVGGRIPERWVDYEPPCRFSNVSNLLIKGLIPSKSFLSDTFTVKNELVWTVDECVRRCNDQYFKCSNGEHTPGPIAAVINLCATERYYDTKSVENKHCIDYFWLPFNGGDVKPELSELFTALEVIAFVCSRCPDQLILIHCTHGVNRTGFLFCLILMTFGKYSLSDALKEFRATRGYEMTRKDLIHVLKEFESEMKSGKYDSYLDQLRAIGNGNADLQCRLDFSARMHSSEEISLNKFYVELLYAHYNHIFSTPKKGKKDLNPLGVIKLFQQAENVIIVYKSNLDKDIAKELLTNLANEDVAFQHNIKSLQLLN